MRFEKAMKYVVAVVFLVGIGLRPAWAEEFQSGANMAPENHGRGGILGLNLDGGYYTYGMNDVNNRLNGRGGSLSGGMGYGAALKLGLTNTLAAKVGVDYLFASAASSRTIGGIKYDTEVDLPATMVFIGGEYAFLPLQVLNLKLIAGYTLVTIYNGDEKATNGPSLDMGSISGSGSGAQIGLGLELFLGRRFSLEGDLAYNFARINSATFAGSPADPESHDAVDYSGMVAKIGVTFYLIP